MQSYPPSELLTSLLRDVSRTFYWTMRVLPRPVRRQIGLAYLLARTTDTIADTEVVPVNERLNVLETLRQRILGQSAKPVILAVPTAGGGTDLKVSNAECALLTHIDQMIEVLNSFPARDRDLIRQVLATITSGQELDLRRFGATLPGEIRTLEQEAELDDYAYRVAGCVGEFWTRICRAHLFPKAPLDDTEFLANGVKFGKGLQLVNILRDLPADLRKGRCYIPSASLSSHALTVMDLTNPENEARFSALYNHYLNTAESYLAAGWQYTNTIPPNCRRVRLACAWPILIGLKTVARLRLERVLDPHHRVKITRREVKRIMTRSVLALAWRPSWDRLYKWSGGTEHL